MLSDVNLFSCFLIILLFFTGCKSDGTTSNSSHGIPTSTTVDTLHSTTNVQVLCKNRPLDDVLVIFTFGQSISANYNKNSYATVDHVFALDDGKCIQAKDPLPIADGTNGSMWIPLGRKIIENGLAKNVLLISVGVGGSSIDSWSPNGDLHQHLQTNLEYLHKLNIPISLFLWHQGTSDIGKPSENYVNNFLKITDSIRSAGFNAPILVAIHSRCFNAYDKNIENAQKFLSTLHDKGIYEGANTNTLDNSFRFDKCHLNQHGQEKSADLWLKAIKMQDEMLSWLSLSS